MHQLAQYIKEREGFDSIVKEHAFASYKITGDACYIKDIWVHSECRNSHTASDIADEIAAEAKLKGSKFLLGSVSTSVGNPTISTKVLLAYGFTITSAVQDAIFFRKEL